MKSIWGSLQQFPLTVPVRCHNAPDMTQRMAFFAMIDDQVVVKDDDGAEIASIGGCMAGHYEFRLWGRGGRPGYGFIIHSMDMWNMFLAALEADGRFPAALALAQEIGPRGLDGKSA